MRVACWLPLWRICVSCLSFAVGRGEIPPASVQGCSMARSVLSDRSVGALLETSLGRFELVLAFWFRSSDWSANYLFIRGTAWSGLESLGSASWATPISRGLVISRELRLRPSRREIRRSWPVTGLRFRGTLVLRAAMLMSPTSSVTPTIGSCWLIRILSG